ncbi:MAG: RluA family pseudouridine synthase [Planctomycetia bacterium]
MPEPLLLCERSGVVALAKPAGLATQAPPGVPSVESWLRARLHGGDAAGYVGVPHRLDRAVSGVLLMTTTPRAARQLSRQFERREVRKEYVALVEPRGVAWIAAGPVEWRDRIEKVPEAARARLADAASAAGREAVTRAWLAARLPVGGDRGRLLLRLEPLTGRMHQLRLQAAVRGLPIVGDLLYDAGADPCWAGPTDESAREPPIALHAERIRYRDPDDGGEVVAAAPLPAFWPAVD